MVTGEDRLMAAALIGAHGASNVRVYETPDGLEVDFMGRGYFLIRDGFLLVDEVQIELDMVCDVLAFGMPRVIQHIMEDAPLATAEAVVPDGIDLSVVQGWAALVEG